VDVKKAVNLVFIGVYGLLWTALDVLLVPMTGIELVTFALRMRCSTN
jgi:hypothetical protein